MLQVDEPGVFSDVSQLKNRPAHVAVFLRYLLSNRDPSALVSFSSRLAALLARYLLLVGWSAWQTPVQFRPLPAGGNMKAVLP